MTERDRWWLTATVWMEARGESRQGKLAVAYVLLNRLATKRWGERAGEVCLAPLQFSCWNHDSPTRKFLARVDEMAGSWIDSENAVALAIHGVKPDPTEGALHYYNPNVVHPSWDLPPQKPRVVIGHHVFVRGIA
jgi:spore germination cell wall hydrolase CwlJ-like protein